jgi:hypothetical protein
VTGDEASRAGDEDTATSPKTSVVCGNHCREARYGKTRETKRWGA